MKYNLHKLTKACHSKQSWISSKRIPSNSCATVFLHIYILSCWAVLKDWAKKKFQQKWKAGSGRQQVCKVWLGFFIASSRHLSSLWNISVSTVSFLRLCSSLFITILKLITGWAWGEEVGRPSVQLWVLGPSGRGWVKRLEEGLVLFVWVPTGQCLQVRLLSGAFIIRSSSSMESMENRNIYLAHKK